ncbi:MAG: hypothetical protein SYC29_16840 [Planctomycetota bacterium]|nr:hypothetical protein [Planctomycetota bacterium]
MRWRAIILAVLAAAFAVIAAHAAASETAAGWLESEAPFLVSREARAVIDELIEDAPEKAASIRALLDEAADTYRRLLEDHADRIEASEETTGRDFFMLWPEWRRTLNAFSSARIEQIEEALGHEALRTWRLHEQRYAFRQIVQIIAQRNQIGSGPPIPDLYEALEEAGIDLSSGGALGDALAAESEALGSLVEAYWRDYPSFSRTMINDRSTSQQRRNAVEGMKAIIDHLREGVSRAAATIAAALDEQQRQGFIEALTCRQRPEFCLPTPVDIAVKLLRTCDSVGQEQMTTIEAFYRDYVAEHVPLRARFIEHQLHWDSAPVAAARDREFRRLHERGERPQAAWQSHPGLPALRRLVALEADTLRTLRAVFTDDELARLPGSIRLALAWTIEEWTTANRP